MVDFYGFGDFKDNKNKFGLKILHDAFILE